MITGVDELVESPQPLLPNESAGPYVIVLPGTGSVKRGPDVAAFPVEPARFLKGAVNRIVRFTVFDDVKTPLSWEPRPE